MDVLMENHTGSSSSSNRSSEIKKIEKLSNQRQSEILMNKTSDQDILEKNEKKIIINGEGSDDLETNDEMHLSVERDRRKKMKEMFDDLSGLLPQLPSKVWISLFNIFKHI